MKRFIIGVLMLIVLLPFRPIIAQGETFQQFFIVDVVTTGTVNAPYRTPAHFGNAAVRIGNPPDAQLVGVVFGYTDIQSGAIVSALITSDQQTYLQSLPDVLVVPRNIDNNIPVNRFTAITNALENKGIPVLTLNSGDTYREFLRGIVGEALVAQRFTSQTGVYVFNPSLENFLSVQFGNLPEDYQLALLWSLEQGGYNTSNLTATNTLRQIFNGMAAQDDNRPYPIGAATL